MQTTLVYIEQKQKEFAAHPFFSFLRDRALSAEERFAFTPAVAPFVMAFGDLNRLVLHVRDARSSLEQLINRHAEEDATHHRMYLRDLRTLGLDASLCFADALRFLWADERKRARHTCYALTEMWASAPTALRIVVLEAVEAAGAAAFETLSALALEYSQATGRELYFFGARHKELETGHAVGTDDIEDTLRSVTLTADEQARARQFVDEVFATFAAMMQELHAFGVSQLAQRTAHGAAQVAASFFVHVPK